MSWIVIHPVVHVASRRIGRLLPLKIEPGRKFVPGTTTEIRRHPYVVKGFGYEDGVPVVHVKKILPAMRKIIDNLGAFA